MILPIVAYGSAVLKKVSVPVSPDYPGLQDFIANMWDTMYNGRGVGLAAPQVGVNIRIFIIDSEQLAKENAGGDEEENKYRITKGLRKTFINPVLVNEVGTPWVYEEGCLSIPEVRVKISRKEFVTVQYFDENFKEHTEVFDTMNARIIQHEYDHIEGILLTDHMTSLKKSLIKRRLDNISKGAIDVKYKMKFPLAK